MKINKTDFEILKVLLNKRLTISELRTEIGIAPVNLWKHLNTLKESGIVKIPNAKRGSPKHPSLVDRQRVRNFIESYSAMIGNGVSGRAGRE